MFHSAQTKPACVRKLIGFARACPRRNPGTGDIQM
jgi:hypothetical protein